VPRAQVFWFGRRPNEVERQLCSEHAFDLIVPEVGTQPDFRFGRAAIFWATDENFAPAMSWLRDCLLRALNDGLYIVPVVSAVEGDLRLQEATNILSRADVYGALSDRYRVRSAPLDLHPLMHQILERDPGPARNVALEIESARPVNDEDRRLLQRAFHDCRAIRLLPIAPGLSGADTFIVDALLIDSNAGPSPMPFFAKLGASEKLSSEMANFRVYAEHHIPWYLRPNFVADRSIYGLPRGILVGAFVQGSTSLADHIRRGDGARHIKSLFEETLSGLRRSFAAGGSPVQRTVVDALNGYCDHERVPETRWRAAADLFGGAPVDPKALWWRLLGLPEQNWLKTAIHGDLHGENVRVRKSDAILIDFAHASVGPACADLAHLEVWIAFDTSEFGPHGDEWRQQIEAIYSLEGINNSLDDPAAQAKEGWIYSSIAEVRAQAAKCISCHDEYARVLAVYLLRQSIYPAKDQAPQEDEWRRTFAYWLACRLVGALEAAARSAARAA
jgi:hypothetical protein